MKGTFTNSEQVEKFIAPIRTIGALVGDNGFNINFFEEDDERVVMIPARNQTAGVVIIHKWKGLFDDFEYDSTEDERIGIFKPNEFVNLFSVFGKDEVAFEFNEDNELSLTQDEAGLTFKTTDPELVSEGKRSFKGCDWLGELEYDSRLSKFTKAMSVMTGESLVFIDGDDQNNTIQLTIKNKDSGNNKYSITVDGKVSEKFQTVFKKDVLQTILGSKLENVTLRIGERLMNVDSSSDDYDTQFYVSRAV